MKKTARFFAAAMLHWTRTELRNAQRHTNDALASARINTPEYEELVNKLEAINTLIHCNFKHTKET